MSSTGNGKDNPALDGSGREPPQAKYIYEGSTEVLVEDNHVAGVGVGKVAANGLDAQLDDAVPLFKPCVCALAACLGSFAFGTVIAWPSPAVPNLNSHGNSGFFIDTEQNSWVGSIVTLGALVGGLMAGPFMDRVGRKLGMMFTLVPFSIGWIVILASRSYACLLVGRAVTGLCMGVLSVICPVYIGEVAPAKIRGFLGSCHQLFVCMGILAVYCLGAVLNWNWLTVFCLACDVALVVAMCFVPETPRWLLSQGRKEDAEFALGWMRGDAHDVSGELSILEANIRESSSEAASFRDFTKPELWKPLAISLGLMLAQQFSGINVIMFYTVSIFQMAQSSLDPNVQSILVGVVGVVGTLVSVFISDLTGRRILLVVSAALMGVSISGMGAFFYEQAFNTAYAEASLTWLPIACLMIFNFGFDCAFGPIPWVMMAELFPLRAKGIASSIATSANWLFAFIITKCFTNMTQTMGTYGAYWFCAAFCFLAIPFVIFFVPETKGKTLEEIERSFK